MSQDCTHLDTRRAVAARTPKGCAECLAVGASWVHPAPRPPSA